MIPVANAAAALGAPALGTLAAPLALGDHEPFATALLLVIAAALLGGGLLVSRGAGRIGVPAALPFLALGMLAGALHLGGAIAGDFHRAFRLGTIALVFILFDGGLHTSRDVVRRALAPAATLATVGVCVTAALVALCAHLVGLAWPAALLVGAITSSTDAAAVFSVLRASGIHLKRRVASTLELESGLNDPMAVALTTAAIEAFSVGHAPWWRLVLGAILQLAVGAAVGFATGKVGARILTRARLPTHGLYPVLTTALAIAAFGAATLLHGSGFLAVYLAGITLGESPLPYRAATLRVHDGVAWFAQVGMFLVLGLDVVPARLVAVAPAGLALALALAVVARPVAALACLAPFRYRFGEALYVGWVGLRGAVPVVLATMPLLAGAPYAREVFDVVSLVVIVSALLPGGTVKRVTRRAGLESNRPPPPPAVVEIVSRLPLDGELLSFYVDRAAAASGAALADVPLPDGAAIALIVRGPRLVAPTPDATLAPGDHVYLVCKTGDRPLVELLFGRLEED